MVQDNYRVSKVQWFRNVCTPGKTERGRRNVGYRSINSLGQILLRRCMKRVREER